MPVAVRRSAGPLLERQAELGAVDAAIAAASRSSGAVVVVRGAPGIGKSALLDATADRAAELGCAVYRARGAELEGALPFGVALQLFERPLAALDRERRAAALAGAAGLAAPLFELAGGLPGGDAPSSAAAQLPLLHGLYWLAANLADAAPVVLLVDDAHWADASTLAWLLYLAHRIEDLGVLLVVALRGHEPGAEPELTERLAGHPAARLVEPAPLSPGAVARLVRERHPAAEPGFCDACSEATDGNPFLLRELLATVDARGIAPVAAQAQALSRMAPAAVSHAVLERLARLPPAATAVARAVAVLGRDAAPRHVAALAELSAAATAAAADALAGADVLRREELAFELPLLAAAVLSDLPPAARAQLHLNAAQRLADEHAPPDRIAAHLLHAPADGNAWAVDALLASAGRSLAGGDPAAAAAALGRALDEPPGPDRRAEVLLALARAEAATGEQGAAARYAAALELVAAPRAHATHAQELARLLAATGRPRAAAAAIDRALPLLGPDDGDCAAALQATWVSVSRTDVSMRAEAAARLAGLRWADAADGARLSHAERMLLAQLASERVFAGEPRDETLRLARLAGGDGRLLELDTCDGVTWVVALSAIGWSDELGEYERGFEAALADARRRGSVLAFATCSYGLMFSRYYSGRLDEAVADARQALGAERFGWAEYAVACRAQLAWAHVEQGDLAAADAVLAPAEDPAWETFPGFAMVREARGRISLERGDAEAALAELLDAGRRIRAARVPNPAVLPWASRAALAAAQLGRHDQARELAVEELAAARRFGAPRVLGIALRAAGLVAQGEERCALLAEAVAVLERSPARLELARALSDLGAELRRGGRREAAREPLREALALAHRFGARPLERRAHAELVAAGARPRRPALTGADALTPGERRVAEMAAAGLGNRQIAEDLFVTVKAVQWHLGNAYKKLGIAGRGELAEALAATRP